MNYLKKIARKIRRYIISIQLSIIEKTSDNGVKYIFRNNNSDKLIIGFSGLGGGDYNYRTSLKNSPWDQLFIKDNWASGLSYYLFEDGQNHPEELTSDFINVFLSFHKYKYIVTLGSSKGGTAAIYYGLKHNFNEIYAGACQYYIGNYIGVFHKEDNYYAKVMGAIPEKEGIEILNKKTIKLFENRINSKTIVHLIYSKEEHTWEDDIRPMLNKMDECKITHIDQIEAFREHSMIGQYMKDVCKHTFC